METKLLVNATEVSALTGLKLSRVYELDRKGLIPTITVGERQSRFSLKAIEQWIESGGSRKNETEVKANANS